MPKGESEGGSMGVFLSDGSCSCRMRSQPTSHPATDVLHVLTKTSWAAAVGSGVDASTAC
jgi:hypothetical protein